MAIDDVIDYVILVNFSQKESRDLGGKMSKFNKKLFFLRVYLLFAFLVL